MRADGDRSRNRFAALSEGTEKRGRGWGVWGAGPGGPAGPAPQGPPRRGNPAAISQALYTNGSDRWISTHTKPGRTRNYYAGATVVDTSGGRVEAPQWPGVLRSYRGPRAGRGTRGSLGNLGDPAVSTDISGSGTGIPISPCPRPRAPVGGSKRGARVVSPNEGNEVRRDGRQGVGASHSSEEAGELDRRTPWSEGGARVVDRKPEPRRGHRTSERVTARRTDRGRDSESATRRAGCVSTRTSGSAGGLGGKPPRPTRRKRPKAAETVPKSNGARRRSTCGSRLLFAGRGDLLLPISPPLADSLAGVSGIWPPRPVPEGSELIRPYLGAPAVGDPRLAPCRSRPADRMDDCYDPAGPPERGTWLRRRSAPCPTIPPGRRARRRVAARRTFPSGRGPIVVTRVETPPAGISGETTIAATRGDGPAVSGDDAPEPAAGRTPSAASRVPVSEAGTGRRSAGR